MYLDNEAKKNLLLLARKTIEEKLFGKSELDIDVSFPVMDEVAGIFVTLHKNGNLRGCIGNIIGQLPLKDGVKELAIASAFSDPRFPSLNNDEYEDIEIEITVLSPLKTMAADDVVLGKHGVVISKGFHKGLLLPQVPIEHNMDKETFLSHTCLKAGLPSGCWKEKETKIETFTGIVFSEKEFQ